MKYLLDTHLLIWALTKPERIDFEVIKIIEDCPNVFISAASFWEISIKYCLGKLDLAQLTPEKMLHEVRISQVSLLELDSKLFSTLHKLPITNHRDPFDRLLVWQAIENNMTLISHDDRLKEYKEYGLKLF